MNGTKSAGFDGERYQREQVAAIRDRMESSGGPLLLEYRGHLLADAHAARVLPGCDPHLRLGVLEHLGAEVEIILTAGAPDIAAGRTSGDPAMTCDLCVLQAVDTLEERGLAVAAVCLTQFAEQPAALALKDRLERHGTSVYTFGDLPGYPGDPEQLCSASGFGRHPAVHTTRPLVVVAGTGPHNGREFVALHQLWHLRRQGGSAGYARWNLFPVPDLPPGHPLNLAYAAAMADIGDSLCQLEEPEEGRDPVTLSERDRRDFPALLAILRHVARPGADPEPCPSPGALLVDRTGAGIVDEDRVREAARQELIRRYLQYRYRHTIGVGREPAVERARAILERAGVEVAHRAPVLPAREAARQAERQPHKGYRDAFCGAAIELPDGTVVTGKNSELMYSTAASVINAIKHLADIPKDRHLLSETVIRNLVRLKRDVLGQPFESLDISETLSALSVSAATNPDAERGFQALGVLGSCEMHMTHVPIQNDQVALRRLGIQYTTDARFTPGGFFLR